MPQRHVTIGSLTLGNDLPLVFIVGPNTLESRAHALEMSAALAEMAGKLGIGLVYKTSFDKANRSSLGSERGIGLGAGLPILAEVRETTGLPVLTDIHEREQCGPAAKSSTSCRSRHFSAVRRICCWRQARRASRSISKKASSWRREI